MPGSKESGSRGSGKTNSWWLKLGLPSVASAVILILIYASWGWVSSRASAQEVDDNRGVCDAREVTSAHAVKVLAEEIRADREKRRDFETRMDTAMVYLVPGYKGAKDE